MRRIPDKLQLILLSFLSLFLELSLIRYIPSTVTLAGFFSNLILLATFAGLGTGLLLAKRKLHVFFLSPLILLGLILLAKLIHIEVNVASSEVIFFKSLATQGLAVQPYFVLPVIFVFTAALYIPIGIRLGQLFKKFPPLTAYSLDILGSIAGIAAFSVLSFYSSPAWTWFLVISLLYLLIDPAGNRRALFLLPLYIALVFCIWNFNRGNYWSPYYRISVYKMDPIYAINVNDIAHQYVSSYAIRDPFYFTPYEIFTRPVYKNVLIIGAGTAGDTAVTLASNPKVEHVDAVEIDPVIINLGKTLDQDHAYADPRVTLHNTDGRQFLAETNRKYDLILYALTDSLTLVGDMSGGIRLESFLYTTDAFAQVKSHLTDHGLFVVYNYYRDQWLVDKLAAMTKSVFGADVYVVRSYAVGFPVSILAGPKLREIPKVETGTRTGNISPTTLPLSTDDWPFFYLRERTVPTYYLNFLGIIAGITFLLYLATGIGQKSKFNLRLFFFGAGFMLLETRSLATFSLLFGTTWLVNALVFGGILLFILLANILCAKRKFTKSSYLYGALFFCLALNFFIPTELFLGLGTIPRYVIAIIFYFTPILIANILFSLNFQKVSESDSALGANMLGAVAGGLFEYTSLIWGYPVLIVFTAAFYLLSIVKVPNRRV